MTRATADNLFGVSDYIVDPSNAKSSFNTIQGAINAANAAGGGTVYIKPGTYTETLTLFNAVDLVGALSEARKTFSLPALLVTVVGNHSYAGTGGAASITGINFTSAPAGDVWTLSNTAGTTSLFLFQCVVTALAGRAVVLASVGGTAVINSTQSYLISSGTVLDAGGSSSFIIDDCFMTSSGGVCILHGGTAGAPTVSNSTLQAGATGIQVISAAASATLNNCSVLGIVGVNFTAAGTISSYHNTWNCSSVTGNYILGAAAGTYRYADDILIGTAINFAPLVVQVVADWKPYATSTTAGTAFFAAADFSVSSAGEVTLVAPPGFIVTYTNVTAAMSPYDVLNTDYYLSVDTSGAAVTLRFPNAPAANQTWVIKDRSGNAAASNITLTTPGGVVNFDGSPTFTMSNNYESIELLSNGTSYEVF